MKKIGKMRTLAIASLSAVALAAPIALAQTTSTNQQSKEATQGEGHGRGHGKGEGWGRSGGRGERGGGGFGEMRGGMQGGLFRGVTLTDDQKAKMQQIGQSFHERTKSLHQELRTKREELRQASDGGTFNEALVTQKLQETAVLQAKMMGEQFKMRNELESVLSSEQKAQIEQKRAEFKAQRGKREQRQVQ
jgi:Spy/CpxP family protein refolding chaperone